MNRANEVRAAIKEVQASAVCAFAFWLYQLGRLSLEDSADLSAAFRVFNDLAMSKPIPLGDTEFSQWVFPTQEMIDLANGKVATDA